MSDNTQDWNNLATGLRDIARLDLEREKFAVDKREKDLVYEQELKNKAFYDSPATVQSAFGLVTKDATPEGKVFAASIIPAFLQMAGADQAGQEIDPTVPLTIKGKPMTHADVLRWAPAVAAFTKAKTDPFQTALASMSDLKTELQAAVPNIDLGTGPTISRQGATALAQVMQSGKITQDQKRLVTEYAKTLQQYEYAKQHPEIMYSYQKNALTKLKGYFNALGYKGSELDDAINSIPIGAELAKKSGLDASTTLNQQNATEMGKQNMANKTALEQTRIHGQFGLTGAREQTEKINQGQIITNFNNLLSSVPAEVDKMLTNRKNAAGVYMIADPSVEGGQREMTPQELDAERRKLENQYSNRIKQNYVDLLGAEKFKRVFGGVPDNVSLAPPQDRKQFADTFNAVVTSLKSTLDTKNQEDVAFGQSVGQSINNAQALLNSGDPKNVLAAHETLQQVMNQIKTLQETKKRNLPTSIKNTGKDIGKNLSKRTGLDMNTIMNELNSNVRSGEKSTLR